MALYGKVAVVIGAASGIGQSMCEIFLQHGVKVVLLDLHKNHLDETLHLLKNEFSQHSVHGMVCDVTKGDEFQHCLTAAKKVWGRLDILVNNAGVINEQKWTAAVDVNLKAVIHGTLVAIDIMGRHRGGEGGVVVNVSSIAGLSPAEGFPVYSATKFGVLGFTRSMGNSLLTSHHGVRVNVLCPSYTKTRIVSNVRRDCSLYPDAFDEAFDSVLEGHLDDVGGLMTSRHVADAAVRLLVEDDTANGRVLRVSRRGGLEILSTSSKL